MRVACFFGSFLVIAIAGAVLRNDYVFIAAPVVATAVFFLWPHGGARRDRNSGDRGR
jgi:hypothetical protein